MDSFDPDYPLVLLVPFRVPSTSTQAVAAGGGDIWLFGSDGGVARVSDNFRDGHCIGGPGRDRAATAYGPIFRHDTSDLLAV